MSYEYKIGANEGDLTLLTDLGITAPPHASYRPFSTSVILANGIEQGNGFPVATWHWDVMKIGWSDILAGYLSGNLSAPVVIRTRLNRLDVSDDYDWATFSCTMRWVTGDEDLQSRRNVGLTIEFTHLVLIPDET
jgi:hypothetical protein